MITEPLEIELKLAFDLANREKLEASALAGATEIQTHRLASTYYDTPERDLWRAGYSLRVRTSGKHHLQTVKRIDGARAGLFVRPEWECPLESAHPLIDERSGPFIDAMDADTLRRIQPIFITDVRRAAFRIDGTDGSIALAVDDGAVRAGPHTAPICEIELELRDGMPKALFDLARRLNEQVPLRLGVRSKAERGYALAAGETPRAFKAEPIVLDPDGDAADAFRVIARSCLRQFRLNEDMLTGSGDAEALHQARVGLRRLRSAFSLYRPLLADDPRAALLGAELRWLAAELGEVRNLDVLIPRCEGAARDLLAAERDRSLARARAELAGPRTRLLMLDLAEWLEIGAWCSDPADPERAHREIAPFATALLDRRRERLERHGDGLAGLDDERRHKIRIEAKKLRYASEFFASLYTSDKARERHKAFVAALEALQDLLGELNDLDMGERMLARLGIDARLPRSGKRARAKLLERAEAAHRDLMRLKRFTR